MKASEKFGRMSDKQFADYLRCNPGGASKAFLLRCEGKPSQATKTKVEYRDRIVYEDKYHDRIVYQDRVVEKEVKVVEKIPWTTWCWRGAGCLFLGLLIGASTGGQEAVATKEVVKTVEVPVEKVVEVPGPVREVIKEVKVVDKERVRLLERQVAQLERDNERLEESLYMIHTGQRQVLIYD